MSCKNRKINNNNNNNQKKHFFGAPQMREMVKDEGGERTENQQTTNKNVTGTSAGSFDNEPYNLKLLFSIRGKNAAAYTAFQHPGVAISSGDNGKREQNFRAGTGAHGRRATCMESVRITLMRNGKKMQLANA